MSRKDQLESILQRIDDSRISLTYVKNLENEANSILKDTRKEELTLDEQELIKKISEKLAKIIQKFVDKWENGEIILTSEDAELFKKDMEAAIINIEGLSSSITINELSDKKENKEKAKELESEKKAIRKKLNRTTDILFKHEEERFKSNQTSQFNNNYPWSIIISMGVVIAGLLGLVVFLLLKKRKNK